MDGELIFQSFGAVLVSYVDLLYSTVEYIKSLAGLAGYKKLTKGTTTAFGAFCGKKLKETNEGVLSATITETL